MVSPLVRDAITPYEAMVSICTMGWSTGPHGWSWWSHLGSVYRDPPPEHSMSCRDLGCLLALLVVSQHGDAQDDIRSSHDSQSMLLLYLYYVILDVPALRRAVEYIMQWDGPHGSHGWIWRSHGWIWWSTSPVDMYGPRMVHTSIGIMYGTPVLMHSMSSRHHA